MLRITTRGVMAISFAAFVLAGCASKTEVEESMVEAAPVVVAPVVEAPVVVEVKRPVVNNGKISLPAADGMGGMDGMEELQGLFYFDFDQTIVKRAGHMELSKHAMVLKEDAALRMRLEGHGDERGTREYNLALGERRANAVRAYLVAEGAPRSQIEVISYGEEKPVDGGHNEAAWAMNRRVEVVYR
ncbi:MAG: peptidoglycan-associated lipoprotein Pal [SAR86 cluster bacterium]|jgi:peptidoglycan-associated lipoprotein